ncbi:hypothetical protein [Aliiroseovarius sp. 2305UL8-7]|uniref:hypothetical protein n=1 Tax=Aliiroseovarius conchicola TaxID=3121637 RepID=UPI003526DD32
MEISVHIGAHCTDDDQLVKSLLKNSDALAKKGVVVPGPGRYRGLLAEALVKLQGARADDDTQDMLLDALVDQSNAKRLILGHKNFLGAPRRSLEHNQLYHLAQRNTAWIRNLFANHDVSYFIGIRNPATFVSAIVSGMSAADRAQALNGIDPRILCWSDTIHAIRDANPNTPITVWCNEDTPLIWQRVMQETAGVAGDMPLDGAFDILVPIMEPEGVERMLEYLDKTEIPSEAQRNRVISAFLEKYAIEAQIEEEIDLPGWTEQLVEELTEAYDHDLYEIESIRGVRLLSA